MEVKIVLDEEEEVLAKYYAEVQEVSVEEAFKNALMDKIREMYEEQAASAPKYKCVYYDEPSEADEDMFMDEDR